MDSSKKSTKKAKKSFKAGKPTREELSNLVEHYKSKLLLTIANMDNMQKRFFKEKERVVQIADQSLILKLLPILEDLNRALEISKDSCDFQSLSTGVNMISKNFISVLKDRGLTRLELVGKKFDPHVAEAVSKEESEEFEEGVVVKELMPAYMLNGHLLRHAKVVVASKKG